MRYRGSLLSLALAASLVAADPNDWVNVNYVVSSRSSTTTSAQNAIVSKADSTAQQGPWTIINKNVKPPSGDVRDYLSWAPYHWPDCNWCSKGSAHFANPNATEGDPSDGSGDNPYDDPQDDTPEVDPGDFGDGSDDWSAQEDDGATTTTDTQDVWARSTGTPSGGTFSSHFRRQAVHSNSMKRMHRRSSVYSLDVPLPGLVKRQNDTNPESPDDTSTSEDASDDSDDAYDAEADVPSTNNLPTPTNPLFTQLPSINLPQPTPPLNPNQPTTTTANRVAGTGTPAEAPAKNGGCTPSPTKSLAPSATWTTCPYVVRDGKVNPDTDTLVGPDAAVHMSQSVLYNAIAYTITKAGKYSQNVGKFIDAYFLSSTTGMHPNMNFGQLVRGIGKEHQVGTFTGILDMRGLVKVVNGLQLMRNTKAPDWTSARETAMTSWMKTYTGWLQGSDLGKQTAAKANNHLTFYVSQVAAAKIYLGDTKGATGLLQGYFSKQFLDQVAQSGEQPFEAVRTRPFHYRCFNLEAMITNAKLGDQLGLNLWTAKSKYGATIQTALDFTMSVDPKGENIADIFPHVAAIAAAYGDSKGKYAAYLQKYQSSYKSQPYFFFDQKTALPNSPAGKMKKRQDGTDASTSDDSDAWAPDVTSTQDPSTLDSSTSGFSNTTIPFECPAVFLNNLETELEDGLYVTCDQLRPFYQIPPLPVDADPSSQS